MKSDFDYDTIPIGYYDDVYLRRRGIQSKWHHMKFNFIKKKIVGSASHLDLACGAGTFLGMISNPRSKQVGVDISFSQVREANRRHARSNRIFLQSDVTDLPFPESTFETVSAVELIEHLITDVIDKALEESFRVLKPGGTLILSTPNYNSLIWIIEPMIGWFSEVSYEDQHITKYNRKSLLKALQTHGFEDISVQGFMFSAPFLAFLGWNFPEKIAKLEPDILVNRFGLLLYASAKKPRA